jgi:hypothetical protein
MQKSRYMNVTTLLHITPRDFKPNQPTWRERLSPRLARRVAVRGQWIRYTGTDPHLVFQSQGEKTLTWTI